MKRPSRSRTSGPAAPRSRSTPSITTCVTLPVITVVGVSAGQARRPAAFCTPIAAVMNRPVAIAHGASGASAAPAGTLQISATTSSAACITSKGRLATVFVRSQRRATIRASATDTTKVGNTSSFSSTLPPLARLSSAPISTKFPVTCAVNSPNSATKPTVST